MYNNSYGDCSERRLFLGCFIERKSIYFLLLNSLRKNLLCVVNNSKELITLLCNVESIGMKTRESKSKTLNCWNN